MKESPISPTPANDSLTSKEYFEANFLDGDQLQSGQLVSAVEVFKYIQEVAQKKYQEGELNGRINEVKNLGGQTMHKVDAGGWCRKSGEQFRECLQCLKDERLSQLERKEQ